MTVLCSLFSPISVAFLVIILGYCLGRIKLFNFSLDLSGVLILAVFTGWIFAAIPICKSFVYIEEYHSYMKFFSTFGTALFVSAIGISTGNILDFRRWQDIKVMLIGSLMVFSAFATMKLIPLFDKSISFSNLLGALCGALTTTPGLSAACELDKIVVEELTLGYGCTYLFGVIATVLFVQNITKNINAINKKANQTYCYKENSLALGGLIQIGINIILGRMIGCIELHNYSLGDSGGMLCTGIVIGAIIKKYFPEKVATIGGLTPFRNTGIVLFFVGNGILSGMQICGELDYKIIIYGSLMTISPILLGIVFCRLFYKKVLPSVVISGGMTSTPAIGILIENKINVNLSEYSMAYIGALLTIVILIRIY